jgi:GNAT superfamily N-acetyltransferase
MPPGPGAARDVRIDPATPADVPLVLSFIRELAEYERMADAVENDEELLREVLFGPRPAAEVVIARTGQEPVGFALFFHNYSTFVGRRGLYLEDVYVRPEARGQGIGRQLLSHLARLALERGCRRFEWWVLNWNESAIRFYESLGAVPMDEWTTFRLTGEPLARLARDDEPSRRRPPGVTGS